MGGVGRTHPPCATPARPDQKIPLHQLAPRRVPSSAMAQHWWVLEELGDLGELDALLADDTGACRAAPGASKGPEGSSGAPLTPSEADDDACAVAPGVDTTAAPTPTASGDNACETEPVGVDSAAAPTTAPPGSPAAALKLRCLDERHPATCARCVRVPHMPLRRRQAAPILLFSSAPCLRSLTRRARAPHSCVPPPDAAVLHLYKLTGDPQKKNGAAREGHARGTLVPCRPPARAYPQRPRGSHRREEAAQPAHAHGGVARRGRTREAGACRAPHATFPHTAFLGSHQGRCISRARHAPGASARAAAWHCHDAPDAVSHPRSSPAQAAELEASAMAGATDAAGTAQLARALLERDCAGLRKQSAWRCSCSLMRGALAPRVGFQPYRSFPPRVWDAHTAR